MYPSACISSEDQTSAPTDQNICCPPLGSMAVHRISSEESHQTGNAHFLALL